MHLPSFSVMQSVQLSGLFWARDKKMMGKYYRIKHILYWCSVINSVRPTAASFGLWLAAQKLLTEDTICSDKSTSNIGINYRQYWYKNTWHKEYGHFQNITSLGIKLLNAESQFSTFCLLNIQHMWKTSPLTWPTRKYRVRKYFWGGWN